VGCWPSSAALCPLPAASSPRPPPARAGSGPGADRHWRAQALTSHPCRQTQVPGRPRRIASDGCSAPAATRRRRAHAARAAERDEGEPRASGGRAEGPHRRVDDGGRAKHGARAEERQRQRAHICRGRAPGRLHASCRRSRRGEARPRSASSSRARSRDDALLRELRFMRLRPTLACLERGTSSPPDDAILPASRARPPSPSPSPSLARVGLPPPATAGLCLACSSTAGACTPVTCQSRPRQPRRGLPPACDAARPAAGLVLS
jgi:hypothetical protein